MAPASSLISSPFVYLLAASIVLYAASSSGAGDEDATAGTVSGWTVLTKRSFSFQIRRHPHILLMVTVPWCGESRSFAKELAHRVAEKQNKLGHIKLMMVFKNSEKVLADSLGAADGITLFFYHHYVPYMYRGHLRVPNILSSVDYLLSLKVDDIPLKKLHTKEDLDNFFLSTDKVLLLFEFCGWSTKLLHEEKNDSLYVFPSGDAFSEKDAIIGENLTIEANEVHQTTMKHKVLETEELTCAVENGFTGSSWFDGSLLANETGPQGFDDSSVNPTMSCTLQEFQRFESFFIKLTKAARKFFLPPERQRFGLITEVSLLPFLGIRNPETWSFVLQFSGCSNCSFALRKDDDLKTLLEMQHPLVQELDDDTQSLQPLLPIHRPSIVLFIDRSSEVSKIRGKSKSSLQALRRFVQTNQLPGRIDFLNTHESASAHDFVGNFRKNILFPIDHFTGEGSRISKIVKMKDNMAVMVVNKEENMSLDKFVFDSQVNSAYDIFRHMFHGRNDIAKNKQTRISLLAKEAEFQVLSNDNVEILDSLSSRKENDNSDSSGMSSAARSAVAPGGTSNTCASNDQLNPSVVSEVEENQFTIHVENVLHKNIEETLNNKISEEIESKMKSGKYPQVNEDDAIVSEQLLEMSSSVPDNSFGQEGFMENHASFISELSIKNESSEEEKMLHEGSSSVNRRVNVHEVENSSDINDKPDNVDDAFLGSFFFCDGGYRLLGSMNSETRVPSLLIFDPYLQEHYVFPEGQEINYSSIVYFVNEHLSGSLTRYTRSAISAEISRAITQPPFVNLDFHEADSIPRVTTNTFCDLVIGFNDCNLQNEVSSCSIQNPGSAWNTDVLVLFSTSWCGFCQRMELIVREIYRSVTYSMIIVKSEKSVHGGDGIDDHSGNDLKAIFLMDCSLNDCAPVLLPVGKKEQYPTLLLFPAMKKKAVVYEGDVSVMGITYFLTSQGRNSNYLKRHKVFPWIHEPRTSKNSGMFCPATQHHLTEVGDKFSNFDPATQQQLAEREANISNFYPSTVTTKDTPDPTILRASVSFHNDREYVVKGSVLSSTDILLLGSPFYNSTVLIVAADRNQGFLGLILNKRINWVILKSVLKEMEMEFLKPAPLFFGGPVMEHTFPLVSLSQRKKQGYTEVIAGFYFGNAEATSETIAGIKSGHQSASDYLFFLGYSGWGWDQLFEELAQGAWHLNHSSSESLDLLYG